tara:strand:+ start:195 stop:1127 length:933 start_codon:yes stop_codon:yes gene_type:complete
MNFNTLHVCLIGIHPLKSFNNILNLVQRILKFNTQKINIKINILYDTTDKESYQLKDLFYKSEPIIQSFINWIEYESRFLNSGNKFLSRNYASLIVQNEPIEFYVNQELPDSDFLLRCRSDYYLTDEFLQMVLDREFYKKLDNSNEKLPIFNKKLWMPYMGKEYIFDCCDYFYITSIKDQRNIIITDKNEAEFLWFDPFSEDKKFFAERIFFVKPLLDFLKNNKINKPTKEYWDLIHSNFSLGGDPSPIKTCFYGWRNSAWCGYGNTGYKVSKDINNMQISTHAQKIAPYSNLDPTNFKTLELHPDKYIY